MNRMTPEQQEGYKAMIEARGRLPGPTKIWVHNPKLAKVAGPFGAHFQPGQYSLSEREREIAVCIITSRWHSAYPTAAHERHAKEVGLPAPAPRSRRSSAACRSRSTTNGNRSSTRWRWCCPTRRWVPRGLHDRAVKALGHVGVTDVITLMGHYTSVAMTLAFYDVPDGATGMAR